VTRFDLECVDGKRLRLRLVRPEDAEYIHTLRMDDRYNAHLSAVSGTIEDQRVWIENYKLREAAGTEYYYIIENRADDCACGVVRLYDLHDGQFTWGSWILDENKPKLAALESAVLSFGVGFELLGYRRLILDVRKKNERAIAFYRRIGASEVGEDDLNFYFQYTSDQFFTDRQNYLNLLNMSEPS
jgi:RimJ/RimL family protein N-acetyltransferase